MTTIRCILLKETDAAKFIRYGGVDIWLPRSQLKSFLKFPPEAGKPQIVEIQMPGWLAAAKGIE